MPKKNKRETQKGFANMIVLIIFLLTVGVAVLYFKNFPLEKLPAEQAINHPQAAETQKQSPTNPFPPTEEVVGNTPQPSKEIKSVATQTESLAGVDADHNGVWDYIDQYINTAYPKDEKLRAGLRQFARSIQNGILNAHDKKLSLQYATESDRAQECVAFLRPNDFNAVLGEMEAQMLNTIARSKEFLVWSEQSAGEVFPSVPISERGKSCLANS